MYKINGYDLYLAFGFVADGDRATADSFEKPAEPVEAFSHTWDNGITEIDLLSPTYRKPKVFTLKGYLVLNTIDDYKAAITAISTVFYQNYVTLESTDLGIKVNARLKPGAIQWDRRTNLYDRIIVAVEFQFDEIKQTMPFKDQSSFSFDVNIQRDLTSTTIDNSIYRFYLNDRGQLIMTTS